VTSASTGRLRVIANCAVSADGRLAYAGGRRARLSGPEDLARVQRLRADSDAILIGVGTVLLDDPSLRVHWELLDRPPGRSPLRVVLDSNGRTPPGARVLDGTLPTLLATAAGNQREFPDHVETFRAGSPRVDSGALLEHLSERGAHQLMVEGGATVLASFLRERRVDELTVYVAPVLIGGRTAPPMLAGPESATEAEAMRLKRTRVESLGEGVLLTYRPDAPSGAPL
jgi:2,5-diamino-6-(ribosylamino)-4(3H)-pyrimidinone 5'-phosphate reductase